MQQTVCDQLRAEAKWLRQELFEMVMACKKGHIPSSYSIVETLVTLYFGGVMNVNSKQPGADDSDRLYISKGHAAMAVYPILTRLGFLPEDELAKFTKADGVLRMYADQSIPGIEAPCGSLGHGFGIGAGQAWAAKKDGKPFRVFCIVGDGECYEGSIWETALFASHYRLNNFITVIDRNRLCILSDTESCISLSPMLEKWQAFGWDAVEVDGHDPQALLNAFAHIGKTDRPLAIVTNTVKGKGISFMEDRANWHNKMPDDAQIAQAREELSAVH